MPAGAKPRRWPSTCPEHLGRKLQNAGCDSPHAMTINSIGHDGARADTALRGYKSTTVSVGGGGSLQAIQWRAQRHTEAHGHGSWGNTPIA